MPARRRLREKLIPVIPPFFTQLTKYTGMDALARDRTLQSNQGQYPNDVYVSLTTRKLVADGIRGGGSGWRKMTRACWHSRVASTQAD